MKDRQNPFEKAAAGEDAIDADRDARHLSDDPGRDYDAAEPTADGPTHSSGPSSPSAPRRAGMGERQSIRRDESEASATAGALIPGEIIFGGDEVEINAGLEVATLTVVNGADRPIQVGSHYHFAEVNAALEFDRDAAWGKRLNVLSGGSVRFEPGAVEEVELVDIEGARIVPGLRGLCGGRLDRESSAI